MLSKLFGGKKGGDAANAADKPFTLDPNELWYLDGKAYDLSKFAKSHPGMYVCRHVCGIISCPWVCSSILQEEGDEEENTKQLKA